jgi:hypothetical protein
MEAQEDGSGGWYRIEEHLSEAWLARKDAAAAAAAEAAARSLGEYVSAAAVH